MLLGSDQNHQRVLGVEWNPLTDSFQFRVRLNFSPRKRKQRTGPDIKPSTGFAPRNAGKISNK